MSDELRDLIVEAIHSRSNISELPLGMLHDDHLDTLEAKAEAVIDALQIEEHEGRYIIGWRPDDPDHKPF